MFSIITRAFQTPGTRGKIHLRDIFRVESPELEQILCRMREGEMHRAVASSSLITVMPEGTDGDLPVFLSSEDSPG